MTLTIRVEREGVDTDRQHQVEHEQLANSALHLPKIASVFHKAKKCVVVTGAGISCSGGIPDFRSSDGLYNLVKSRFPKSVVKGRDLFDATLFKDETSTRIFYSFMGELKHITDQATVTRTHRFIGGLYEKGKLLRCYTQNIDCLEQAAGLPPNAGDHDEYFTPQATSIPKRDEVTPMKVEGQPVAKKRGVAAAAAKEKKKTLTMAQRAKLFPVVQLHGSLSRVKCTLCTSSFTFTMEYREEFKAGGPPPCPTCKEKAEERLVAGKRRVASGTLRPDIILYNEPHPKGDLIASFQVHDHRRKPDVLLVMGTSLKVCGIKRLVKDLAACIHDNGGTCIFVNRTPLASKEWEDVFDYQILSDADYWVEDVELRLESLAPKAQRTLVKTPASMLALSETPSKAKARATLASAVTSPSMSILSETATAVTLNTPSKPKNTRKMVKGKENQTTTNNNTTTISTLFKKSKATRTHAPGKAPSISKKFAASVETTLTRGNNITTPIEN